MVFFISYKKVCIRLKCVISKQGEKYELAIYSQATSLNKMIMAGCCHWFPNGIASIQLQLPDSTCNMQQASKELRFNFKIPSYSVVFFFSFFRCYQICPNSETVRSGRQRHRLHGVQTQVIVPSTDATDITNKDWNHSSIIVLTHSSSHVSVWDEDIVLAVYIRCK